MIDSAPTDPATSPDGDSSRVANRGTESTDNQMSWLERERSGVDEGAPKSLVVCLDRSDADKSLVRHAAALARVWMARVTLIHVLESDRSGEIPDPVDTVQWLLRRKEASRFLATVASAPICQDLQMDTELGEGCAFEQIQTWSNLHGVDITVLSTHGELASTAHKLINGSSGSLLVVPVGESSPTPSEPVTYKRVLVPLDGSHHAESVLPIATQLAEAHRAELILAHVVPTPELIRIGPPDADDLELEESLIRRNEKIAGRYLTRVHSHIQSPNFRSRTYLSRKGDPRDELLRIIYDESVDLVVLSAHGATGATDRALGTVAAHLVAHARVPLLLTRERTRCTAPWDRASAGRLSIPMRLPGATTA